MRDDIKGCLLGSAPPPAADLHRLLSSANTTSFLYLVCYYAAYDAMRSIEDSRYDNYVLYIQKILILTVFQEEMDSFVLRQQHSLRSPSRAQIRTREHMQ